jgi:hypothetical protein
LACRIISSYVVQEIVAVFEKMLRETTEYIAAVQREEVSLEAPRRRRVGPFIGRSDLTNVRETYLALQSVRSLGV